VPIFRIDPGRSRVWIEARSSLHPILGEADGLEGSVEAEMADGRDARRFPTIRGEMTHMKKGGGDGHYRVRGDLTFHGVTRSVEGDITISSSDGHSLVIEGEQTFNIRDYGVEPPKILLLKVHPDVKVRVKVFAEAQG
jgi:polyisoprenoid-binding protein YceI